jgi:hypothetical protein
MKKLIFSLIIIGSALVTHQAFATSPVANGHSLNFSNITQTTADVSFVAIGDEYQNYLDEGRAIKIQYRPWGCGDTPGQDVVCTMLYIQPIEKTFDVFDLGNGKKATRVMYLTNLQPNTKYRVWLGYDNGIRCIQAPCPSDTWDDTVYSFTTTDGDNPYPVELLTQKLSFGSRGSQVNILENFLFLERYMTTYIDNFFGTVTHAAVMRYQADHGLKADGVVGAKTRTVINQQLNTQERMFIPVQN